MVHVMTIEFESKSSLDRLVSTCKSSTYNSFD